MKCCHYHQGPRHLFEHNLTYCLTYCYIAAVMRSLCLQCEKFVWRNVFAQYSYCIFERDMRQRSTFVHNKWDSKGIRLNKTENEICEWDATVGSVPTRKSPISFQQFAVYPTIATGSECNRLLRFFVRLEWNHQSEIALVSICKRLAVFRSRWRN